MIHGEWCIECFLWLVILCPVFIVPEAEKNLRTYKPKNVSPKNLDFWSRAPTRYDASKTTLLERRYSENIGIAKIG